MSFGTYGCSLLPSRAIWVLPSLDYLPGMIAQAGSATKRQPSARYVRTVCLSPSRSRLRSVEVAHEMVAQIACVLAGAVDERRFAAAQELRAEQVHAWPNDAAIVAYPTLPVEYRDMQPGQIRAVSCCPDDRADSCRRKVNGERRRLGDLGRLQARRWLDLAVA